MIGLDKWEPANNIEDRSNAVKMLQSLGFIVPVGKEEGVFKKWDTRETLRFYMRWRTYRGCTREQLLTKLGQLESCKKLLVEVHNLDEYNEAVSAVESRRTLLANVVKDLSMIYVYTLENDIPLIPPVVGEIVEIQEERSTLTDLLRETMAQPVTLAGKQE